MDRMTNKVLVAGATGKRGRKIARFLKGRGLSVYGIGLYPNEEDIQKNKGFFRIQLNHRDSVRLVLRIVKPDFLVYCALTEKNENNYGAYLNILLGVTEYGVKRVCTILDTELEKDPENLYDLAQWAMVMATSILHGDSKIEHKFITPGDNLLKEVKSFLIKP